MFWLVELVPLVSLSLSLSLSLSQSGLVLEANLVELVPLVSFSQRGLVLEANPVSEAAIKTLIRLRLSALAGCTSPIKRG